MLVRAGLLQLLELPGQSERLLAGAGIAMSTLPNVVQAAWQLHDSVEALKVARQLRDDGIPMAKGVPWDAHGVCDGSQGKTLKEGRGLPGELSTMTAVVEQRNRLQTLSRRFVEQATRFLGQELDHIADGPLNRATALAGLTLTSSLFMWVPAPPASCCQASAC